MLPQLTWILLLQRFCMLGYRTCFESDLIGGRRCQYYLNYLIISQLLLLNLTVLSDEEKTQLKNEIDDLNELIDRSEGIQKANYLNMIGSKYQN